MDRETESAGKVAEAAEALHAIGRQHRHGRNDPDQREAVEAAKALCTSGRQPQRKEADYSWGEASQVAVIKIYPHAGHEKHRCPGDDPAPKGAISTLEVAEASHSRFPQVRSQGGRLTRGRTEDTLGESKKWSSTGGRHLPQVLGQRERRSSLA